LFFLPHCGGGIYGPPDGVLLRIRPSEWTKDGDEPLNAALFSLRSFGLLPPADSIRYGERICRRRHWHEPACAPVAFDCRLEPPCSRRLRPFRQSARLRVHLPPHPGQRRLRRWRLQFRMTLSLSAVVFVSWAYADTAFKRQMCRCGPAWFHPARSDPAVVLSRKS
jgi:hypothetical protein